MSYETSEFLRGRLEAGAALVGPSSTAADWNGDRFDTAAVAARAVADVMHYCRASGLDPFEVERSARRLYMAELDGCDEEPYTTLQPWPQVKP